MRNKNIYSSKKGGFAKYISMLIFVGIIAAAVFVMFSPQFEQEKPTIIIKNDIYWNLKTKLKLELQDNGGIKYYKVVYKDGSKSIDLNSAVLSGNEKNIKLDIAPPKLDMFYKGDQVSLEIEVIDNSKWNFLEGNKQTKIINVVIDTKKPIASVIDNSRYIRRGGSALVVVQVEDKNLQDAYISFNDKVQFKLIPFYKNNHYAALIAWDVNIKEFKKVNLIAIDYANNKTITKIPLYTQKLRLKKDTIKISSKFIEQVSSSVLEQSGEDIPVDLKDRFKAQNEILREKNVKFLRNFSYKKMDMSKIDSFNIKPFRRLRGSRTAAGYAEKRNYIYKNDKIDEAWHLGMDWASVKRASVKCTNIGEVTFNEYLGIYGNTIIIDHKLGLSSLYAHTSTSHVEVGDIVKAKQKIANTGSTGAVMGDHLHFGILIQGIEVNPLEWMDKNWIKNNITKIMKNSKQIIDEISSSKNK